MRSIFKTCIVSIVTLEARLVVRKYKPHIVAVTGSVGKTSTKDAIYAVLTQYAHVRKSDKSFNSELGLPLTILGCPNGWNNPLRWLQNIIDGLFLIVFTTTYPEWLVLEVGADRPGDISSLAKWLPVDIAVITRLPEVPVHVEFFDSPEAVVREKASLINALVTTGTLVVYADDARRDMLVDKAQKHGAKVVTFGLSGGADVRADNFTLARGQGDAEWPTGVQAQISVGGASAPVSIQGTLGSHMMLPAVAAAAVGYSVGMALPNIVQGLARYEPPRGRMHLLEGIKNTLLIDDTYNSSPAAIEAAFHALADIKPKGRIIAVLGDMLELGRHSVEEHRKVGAHAAKVVDILCTIGFRARDMAEGALDNGLKDKNIFQYEDAERAGQELAALLKEGDCVLVKGSQSMRMERTVEHLMKNPERAPELLVRQELNWKRR
jgi:UDP-N-acetylmuramoyl-tripeptide--D-alanyl-D-alanine ligase